MVRWRLREEFPTRSGILISPKLNPSGSSAWRVDVSSRRTGGKRVQRQFRLKSEALDYARRTWLEIQAVGHRAFTLTGAEREDAVRALDLLRPIGLTLLAAAEVASKQHLPYTQRVKLDQLREMFLAAPARMRGRLVVRRPRSQANQRARTLAFTSCYPDLHADEVSTSLVKRWFASLDGISPLTRNNYRRAIHALFGFAVAEGHIRENPVSAVPMYAVQHTPPAILTVDQARRLLEAAAQTNDRLDLLGYVVLGLFAGLRRAELERLTWKAIKWDRQMITVDSSAAKTASIRNVPLPDNAMAWLRTCDPAERRFSPKGFRCRFTALRRLAGITEWSGNELRHSFASYHYDHHQNAALTSASLGHSSGNNLLFTHYRSLVPLGEGARYFSLLPDLGESGEAPSALPTGTLAEDDLKVS